MNNNKGKLLCIALILISLPGMAAVGADVLTQDPEEMPWLSATGSDSVAVTVPLVGTINGIGVPGPNTSITTNVSGVNLTYDISDEFVTVGPDLSTAPPMYDLIITDFNISPESQDVATLDWTLAYTGPDASTVNSRLYYKNADGMWILISVRSGLNGVVVFDTGSLPAGTLESKLVATAYRAPIRYAFPSTTIPFHVDDIVIPLTQKGKIILQ